MKNALCLLLTLYCCTALYGQSDYGWSDKPESEMREASGRRYHPLIYRTVGLEVQTMRDFLNSVPFEPALSLDESNTVISIPTPDGGIDQFRLVGYSVMEPELAARYPDIRTYRGVHTDDPFKTIRCDWTVRGFSAIVSSGTGRYYVEPFARGNQEDYLVFYKHDYPVPAIQFTCGVQNTDEKLSEAALMRVSGDCTFRSYRLAVAATGEYSNYFGATSAANESVVLSEVVIAVNRVNEVYERDVAVRFILIANTTNVFYYNPSTDPFSGDACNQLNQNQSNMTSVIGSANYDVGHVFSTGSGGCAGLGVVCNNSQKARGATGINPPEGDLFYIDYVSHELGHQFGANHTQNNSCNSVSATRMEPGSASTIMGYAGICSPNVQNNSDDYFHGISVQEINAHISGGGGGNSCDVPIAFNNSSPVLTAGADYTIPKSTPFMLTAIANDPDGDPMTYCWEQWDNEAGSMPPSSTNTVGPMFRSFDPDPSPTRYFPRLQDLVNNVSPTWEVLPSVTRNMEFRITVRDFHSGMAGCTNEDNINVNVSSAAGPFVVTSPNSSSEYWLPGTSDTVNWNVANTTSSPVSCANVNILLSYDGGFTYPETLATNVPNDGSHAVLVPPGLTSSARVMVRCANNVFFDISNQNFEIVDEIPVIQCHLDYSTDVPKAISSSGTPTITSQLVIPYTGAITDVNVIDLEGTHTYLDDLRFILTSPEGTEVILIDRWCGSQNNFDINLNDKAPPGNAPCPYNNGNTYQPEESLAAFNGENPSGTWVLTVQDLANQDGGSLNSWALEICVDAGCTVVTSTADSGAGSLRDAISCVDAGGTIIFSSAIFNSPIFLFSPISISKNISIVSSPAENITVDASSTTHAFTIRESTEVMIADITIVGGTEMTGCGIRNFGDLTLTDVTLHSGPLPVVSLLENLGTLTLVGICQISH